MSDTDIRRRRIGLIALVATIVLFVIGVVGLALGNLEIAAGVFAIFVVGWFVLRSWMKRTGLASR